MSRVVAAAYLASAALGVVALGGSAFGCATLLGIDGEYKNLPPDAGSVGAGGNDGDPGPHVGGGGARPSLSPSAPQAPSPPQDSSEPGAGGVSGASGETAPGTTGGAAGTAGGGPTGTDGLRVRRVVTGSAAMPPGEASTTVTFDAVDMDRSLLVFGSAFDSESAPDSELTGQLTSGTEITFARLEPSSSAPSIPVHYYLVEFERGLRVQRGTITVDDSSEVVELPQTVDLLRSFPLISVRNGDPSYDIDDFVRAEITEPAELSLQTYQVLGEAVVEWQVVSLDDTSGFVQAGTVSLDGNETILRVPLAQPVDPLKTWLVLSYQVDDLSVQADESMIHGRVEAETELVFERSGTGTNAIISYYAISFQDETSVQAGTALIAADQDVATVALTAVDSARAIALAAGSYQRAGITSYSGEANPGYATFLTDLGPGSELTLTRGAPGAAAALNWFVLEFP